MKALEQMMKEPQESPSNRKCSSRLLKEGMLDKDGKGKLQADAAGRSARCSGKALMEVFANLRNGQPRRPRKNRTAGANGERIDGTKPYQFGDPVSPNWICTQTLHNALSRHGLPNRDPNAGGRVLPVVGKMGKISVRRKRFRAAPPRRHHQLFSTVVLLDMSGSMMRYGRFPVGQKSRNGDAGLDPGKVPAGLASTSSGFIPERQPNFGSRWSRCRCPNRSRSTPTR